MAVDTTKNAYAGMDFPLQINRQDAFPLDGTEVWPSLAEAQTYAQTNPTAYVGQKISVMENGKAVPYVIEDEAGTLKAMSGGGGGGGTGNVSSDDVSFLRVLSQEEYDLIEEPDSKTIYYIMG